MRPLASSLPFAARTSALGAWPYPFPPINHPPPYSGKDSHSKPRKALKGFAMLRQIYDDEAGATAIEYGLIIALIALAATIAFQSLGLTLTEVFETITAALRTNL